VIFKKFSLISYLFHKLQLWKIYQIISIKTKPKKGKEMLRYFIIFISFSSFTFANIPNFYKNTLSSIGQRVEIVENNRSTSYSYDDLSRVISEEITDAKNGDYSSTYTYDEVNNRVQSVIDGVTTQYNYDDNDRLTQQGGTLYSYDDQGNTLSQTLDYNSTSYSYNAKNQLTEVLTDSETITYSYNLKGIRTGKDKASKSIQYIVDSNQAYAQVVQEIEDNLLAVSYTYGHDLLSQTRDNKTYDYHYDALGSARYLSDSNGRFTDSYNYEAFGKLLNQEGNTTNNYKFTGEQLDEETQNYYLRSRYFSPLRGGFTQQDSYMGNGQDPITLHKYLYANGNPVSNIDPSGYFSMVEASSAMGIQSSLQNMQIGAYSNFTNVITGGWDGVSLDDIPELALTAVGLRLLVRFASNFFSDCKRKKKNSFEGSTLVATDKGLIPIQEIKIGDKVWAYNEVNQSKSLQEVTHLIRGEHYKELIDIELISGEVITTTDNHPFWTIDTQSWIEADELINSSILLNINDKNTTIKSLKHYNDKREVYNLTVGNIHTYYIGLDGVLGHNDDDLSCPWDKVDRPDKDQFKFYENTGTHDRNGGTNNFNPSKSLLPKNYEELWIDSKSVNTGQDGKRNRWTKVGSGKKAVYHRFQGGKGALWHWNGSTNGVTFNGKPRAIKIQDVPNEVLKW